MAKSQYQGNWRGARRYRFDEEARLKKAARSQSSGWSARISRRLRAAPIIPLALLLVGIAGAALSGALPIDRLKAAMPGSGCLVKGNISVGGQRIYHAPGQRYYGETRVALHFGERWFCSEAEARRAGWRRAKV
jgi:hypothetical protein